MATADHPERNVFNPLEGCEIPIDIELATLMSHVWKRGIRTEWSCQEAGSDLDQRDGRAYIVFPTVYDAQRFLEIAAEEHSERLESIYNRVVTYGASFEDGDWRRRRRFIVEGWPRDLNCDYVPAESNGDDEELLLSGPPRISLDFAIYFPRDDIAELEKRFALPGLQAQRASGVGRDLVLRGYGEVMTLVQQWELGLALLWWRATRKQKNRPTGDFDTPRSQKEITRLEAAFLRETAGSVIPVVSAQLAAKTAAELKPLWDARNRLAHRFLREQPRDDGHFSPGTHDELIALGNRFYASLGAVADAVMSGGEYAGPVLDHWPALAERLLDRLERSERIPRDPAEQ